jgi:hypothetical protein
MGLMPDLTTRPVATEVEVVGEAEDAYELLRSVYSNSALPIGMRMRAAIEALPFEKPKLAVTAHIDGGETFAAALERAIKRSGKVIEAQAIEAEPTPDQANRTVLRRL